MSLAQSDRWTIHVRGYNECAVGELDRFGVMHVGAYVGGRVNV